VTLSDFSPGFYADIPPEEYHRRQLGVVSCSAMTPLDRSPAHYVQWLKDGDQEEPTPALTFGSAFHCAALEPERFALEYVAEPVFGDCRSRTSSPEERLVRRRHMRVPLFFSVQPGSRWNVFQIYSAISVALWFLVPVVVPVGKRTVDIEGERAKLAARLGELDAEVIAHADWVKVDKIELEQFERDQKPERREIRKRRWALNELELRRRLTDEAKKPKEERTDGEPDDG
jgi:hypothetical protein